MNCRNFFVHGGQSRFDYRKHNAYLITFFTDTLEFVFAVSDLIDAGWDAQSWIVRPTVLAHPFARYRYDYARQLQQLKSVLAVSVT